MRTPWLGTKLDMLSAAASDGSALSFVLSVQSVAGALSPDVAAGRLIVAAPSAFDHEANTSVTAEYTASRGSQWDTGTLVAGIQAEL